MGTYNVTLFDSFVAYNFRLTESDMCWAATLDAGSKRSVLLYLDVYDLWVNN